MNVHHFVRPSGRRPLDRKTVPLATDPDVNGTSTIGCPRCGSDLVLPARSGVPSECVYELRDGAADIGDACRNGSDEWVCHFCGHRWPHVQTATGARRKAPADPSDLEPSPAALLVPQPPDEPDTAEPSEGATPGPGSTLARARRERGLTLSQAAEATRIWERDLEALERDAPIEEFAAPAYARFFLREYAEFLGLDPAVVVAEFDRRHPTPQELPFEPLPDPRPRRRTIAIVLSAVSVLSLLGIALLPLVTGSKAGPRAEPAPAAPVETQTGASEHAGAARQPSPPSPHGVRAVLRLTQPCWIRAVADGHVLANATFQPGEPITYRAHHHLRLILGNAGAAHLRVNGRRITTGELGQVVRLEFRQHHDRLSTRRV